MAIIRDGKEYEYNIDGDLVPKGTVKIGNMYGDFKNRWKPGKNVSDGDSEFSKAVEKLFEFLDPTSSHTQEDINNAIDEFVEGINVSNGSS